MALKRHRCLAWKRGEEKQEQRLGGRSGCGWRGRAGQRVPQIGGACGEGWARRMRPATELCEGHMAEFLLESRGEESEKVLRRDGRKGVFGKNESG